MSEPGRLTIVAAGSSDVSAELALQLADRLGRVLPLPICVDKASFRRSALEATAGGEREDRGRKGGQEESNPVSSNTLVDALIDGYPESSQGWILGLTAHDLSAPGRSYVFGEATMGGRWAVVSLARLGAPGPASPRLLDRLCSEALHEIGHLSGLEHCSAPTCVMSVSSAVAAIDAKSAGFCAGCEARFRAKQVEG